MTKIIPFDGVKHADQTNVCCLMVHQIEVLLEPNSHYQTYQRRCDEFQRNNQKQTISYKNRQKKYTHFGPSNSFNTEPSKSLLKSTNTTNIPITIGKKTSLWKHNQETEKKILNP